MGNNSSRVQIANAFSQHVYVKTDVNIVKYSSEDQGGTLSLEGHIDSLLKDVGGKVEGSTNSEVKAEYHVLNQAGFSILPKGEITAYTPPSEASNSNTVYVTMFYLKDDGTSETLQDNVPLAKKSSWVITRLGGLTESLSFDPFVGVADNKNHATESCTSCTLYDVCNLCYVETQICKVQNSIGTIQVCHLGRSLVNLLVDLQKEKVCSKNDKGKKMLKDIEDLAKKYWSLETITKRVIRDIQTYGENLQEAAEDFENDGIISDFLNEITDLDNVKKSLMDANEKHVEIKKKVDVIQNTAEKEAITFAEERKRAEESIATLDSTMALISDHRMPLECFVRASQSGVEFVEDLKLPKLCEVPLKYVMGGVVGISGGAIGLISLSSLPLLWAEYIYHNGSREAYDVLEKQFVDIASQMGLVEEHLVKIEDCLNNIEKKLNQGGRAKRNLVKKLRETDEEKKHVMATRAINAAKELVEACQIYFDLAKMPQKELETQENKKQPELLESELINFE